jgi:hypothetical protein
MRAVAADEGLHMDDLREEIARLEARIEELADALERCRKIVLVSKAAIAVGGVLILAIVAGVIRSEAAAIGGIAAIIGGTVLFGSNSSTAKETAAALQAAEARRAELIGKIELRVVGDGRSLPRSPSSL